MPFGKYLLLKSKSDFSNILSLNLCWQLGEEQLLSIRELVCDSLESPYNDTPKMMLLAL